LDIEETLTYDSDSDCTVTGLILNNDLFGGMEIPIKFYTLTLWVENELELEWSDSLELSALGDGLYFGIDNVFNIKDYISIAINYEQDIIFTPGSDIGLSSIPFLGLSGEYSTGISWALEFPFSFNFVPYVEKEYQSSEAYVGFTLDEALAEISFEFFHFFAPEDISCAFYLGDTLTIDVPVLSDDGIEQNKTITNEIETGFDFGFYGFAPYVHMLLTPENYVNYTEEYTDPAFYLGVGTGFEYSVDIFSLGVDYTGQRNVNLLSHDKPLWENEVEVWILISL
jgi:hypothetical protein